MSFGLGACSLAADHQQQKLLECSGAVHLYAGGAPGQAGFCPAEADGLTECMEEAECASPSGDVPEALENAVLTILREIGDDPTREVRTNNGQM